jgi:hypothetical protein
LPKVPVRARLYRHSGFHLRRCVFHSCPSFAAGQAEGAGEEVGCRLPRLQSMTRRQEGANSIMAPAEQEGRSPDPGPMRAAACQAVNSSRAAE